MSDDRNSNENWSASGAERKALRKLLRMALIMLLAIVMSPAPSLRLLSSTSMVDDLNDLTPDGERDEMQTTSSELNLIAKIAPKAAP